MPASDRGTPNVFRAVGFPIDSPTDQGRVAWELARGSPFVERAGGFVIYASAGGHARLFIAATKENLIDAAAFRDELV